MGKAIDLRPQVVDLKLYAGDGALVTLTVVDKNNNPVNLTGAIKAQVRTNRDDSGSPLTSFSIDLTNRVTGVVVLKLTGTQTTTIFNSAVGKKVFTGFWDVEWTPSGDEPRTLCQGKVECDLDVSR